jgi:hypothetical protein
MKEQNRPTSRQTNLHVERTHDAWREGDPFDVSSKEPPMPLTDALFTSSSITVEPWADPVVDELGHDPRSPYVERFWLAILGPSTVWLLRRLADGLDREPAGFALDLQETARSIGVGLRGGRSSPFFRSVDRSCRFGAARFVARDTLEVRRKLPPLTQRQVSRLPDALQREHGRWIERRPRQPTVQQTRERAQQLALSLLEIGEDRTATERQLHHWRFHPAIAHDAVRWALDQQRRSTSEPNDAA